MQARVRREYVSPATLAIAASAAARKDEAIARACRAYESATLVANISLDTFLRVRSYTDILGFTSSWLPDPSDPITSGLRIRMRRALNHL